MKTVEAAIVICLIALYLLGVHLYGTVCNATL